MSEEHINVRCSACKKGYKTGFFDKCPHCGAEIIGGTKKKETKKKPEIKSEKSE